MKEIVIYGIYGEIHRIPMSDPLSLERSEAIVRENNKDKPVSGYWYTEIVEAGEEFPPDGFTINHTNGELVQQVEQKQKTASERRTEIMENIDREYARRYNLIVAANPKGSWHVSKSDQIGQLIQLIDAGIVQDGQAKLKTLDKTSRPAMTKNELKVLAATLASSIDNLSQKSVDIYNASKLVSDTDIFAFDEYAGWE